jgi:copper(I)-binding protein
VHRITFLIAGLAILLALAAARAGEIPVEIKDAWVRAVPPGSPATAAYMRISNTGDIPLKLSGGRASFAGVVKPMITIRKKVDGKEVSGMELVDALIIPARGETILEPGGDHLMLMKMTGVPAPGETVKVTLIFDPGATEVSIMMPVFRMAPK